jgi:hypothetical protein
MPRYGQEGISTGAAGMDVDHDPQGQTTPTGTRFDNGFTTPTSKGAPTRDPPAGVHTDNFYTPLYTDSQTTSHSDRTTTTTDPVQDAQPAAGTTSTPSEAEAEATAAAAEAEAAAAAEAEASAAKTSKTEQHAAAAAAKLQLRQQQQKQKPQRQLRRQQRRRRLKLKLRKQQRELPNRENTQQTRKEAMQTPHTLPKMKTTTKTKWIESSLKTASQNDHPSRVAKPSWKITPRMRRTPRRPGKPPQTKGRKVTPRPRNEEENKTMGAR